MRPSISRSALDGKKRLQGAGEIAWTEDDGKTGALKFTNVSRNVMLRAWLADDAFTQRILVANIRTPSVALDSLDKIQIDYPWTADGAIKASVPRRRRTRRRNNVVAGQRMPPPGFHNRMKNFPEEWSEQDVTKRNPVRLRKHPRI